MKKFVLMLLFTVCTASGWAQIPKVVLNDKVGWHKIGETVVSFDKETDKILIIGANRFASVKIKVTEAPIRLESFDIFYDNNQKKSVKLAQEIKQEGETAAVDLGGEKNVQKVIFYYHTAGQGKDKKAHVELWGMKSNTDK